MKRLVEENHLGPNFIGIWDLKEPVLCKNIIQFFEKNQANQIQGGTASGVDLSKKNSLDMEIKPKELDLKSHQFLKNYIKKLYECYSDYLEQWPFLKEAFPNLNIGAFNIQKYNPGGHFSKVHSERTDMSSLHRIFAFMTYLNDDFKGGNTSFTHQGIDIKPVLGKTLIWPAEWTHAHKGNIVKSGTKYIVTGWIDLPFT